MIFIAQTNPSSLCSTRNTSPNRPLPSFFCTMKSSFVVFFFFNFDGEPLYEPFCLESYFLNSSGFIVLSVTNRGSRGIIGFFNISIFLGLGTSSCGFLSWSILFSSILDSNLAAIFNFMSSSKNGLLVVFSFFSILSIPTRDFLDRSKGVSKQLIILASLNLFNGDSTYSTTTFLALLYSQPDTSTGLSILG